jgi:uncharacterized protein YprB with RNaseH-like and TPR domain
VSMIKTLVLDLETTDLEADRGVMLCACYESSDEPGAVVALRQDETNKRFKTTRGDDKALVKAVMAVVADHDVVVAHNGARFDLPFLRTRALFWDLPPLLEIKTVDPLQIAWRKFRLHSNRLGSLSDHLGLKDKKTPLDLSVWARATLNGDIKAMDLIVEHCVADVRVLSAVLGKVRKFIRQLDDRGSAL